MKVAILGTENSHALAFTQLIKNDPDFKDVELVGVYGYDKAANDAIMAEGICGGVAEKPEDFLGKVDGILCTARHGDHHHEYALPYVEAGLPCFIDKPFTVDLKKAEALVAAAQKSGAPLCGGSSLKHLDEARPLRRFAESGKVMGGYVAAPINMVNPYGGYYFYSAHLVEILFSIFGMEVKSVSAFCPDEQKDRLTVRFDYGDFDVAGMYSHSYTYSAAVFTEAGVRSAVYDNSCYCYKIELAEYFRMAKTGVMPHTFDELTRPLKVMHAVEDAYKTGKIVEVVK